MLVEPIKRRSGDVTRAAQTRRHTIAIDLVEADLQEAGFQIVRKDATFVSRPEHQTDAERKRGIARPTDWLVVAVNRREGR